MKRTTLLLLVLGILLPAGLALRAQEAAPRTDLDDLIENARKRLAERAASRTKPVVFEQRLYDIRDLTTKVEDYPARAGEINLTPSGGFGFGFFEVEGAEPLPFYEGDAIADLVRESVAPGSWSELKSADIRYQNGYLVVRHVGAVHERIERLLDELRARTAAQVHLAVRWLRLPEAALNEILGPDAVAVLDADGEARLVRMIAEGRAESVREGAVQCVNTQRVGLTDVRRRFYLQDYDVEIAQGSSISDPILKQIDEGTVVDVRPVLAGEGDFLLLDIRADGIRVHEPLPQAETPAGPIEVPICEALKLRTTVGTRVGRPVVIGGTLADGDGESLLLVVTPTVDRPGRR